MRAENGEDNDDDDDSDDERAHGAPKMRRFSAE
jgi:hypothetical protein